LLAVRDQQPVERGGIAVRNRDSSSPALPYKVVT
jgi:hypothetical protein